MTINNKALGTATTGVLGSLVDVNTTEADFRTAIGDVARQVDANEITLEAALRGIGAYYEYNGRTDINGVYSGGDDSDNTPADNPSLAFNSSDTILVVINGVHAAVGGGMTGGLTFTQDATANSVTLTNIPGQTGVALTASDEVQIVVLNQVFWRISDNDSGRNIHYTSNATGTEAKGRVGIGTDSPANPLHVHVAGVNGFAIQMTNTTTGTTSADGFQFGLESDEDSFLSNYEVGKAITFSNVQTGETDLEERMRIHGNGNIGIGTASPSQALDVDGYITSNFYIPRETTDTLPTAALPSFIFRPATNTIGFGTNNGTINQENLRINSNGTITARNAITTGTLLSDRRLKSDVKPLEDALAKVNALSGYTFTFDPTGENRAGIMAQDLEEVLPTAVYEFDANALESTQEVLERKAIHYEQMSGLYVEAIKELTAKIEALEARIETLED